MNISVSKREKSKLPEVDFNNLQFGKTYTDHMFVADFENGEWKNPRIIPYGDISLAPATAVLHYSQTIFEGMKAYKGSDGKALLFRPMENMKRLNASADRMCIPHVPEEVFMGGLQKLIEIDKEWIPSKEGCSLYVRPFVFASDEYIGVKPSDSYTFMIIAAPVGGYYTKPVKVKIETKYARAFPGGTGSAKAGGNYAAALYPAKQAQLEGFDQLVWTDGLTHTFIEESGTMNIMFVIDGVLVTPQLSETILHGITRDSIISLAKDMGIKVEERKITIDEVLAGIESGSITEAFGTGTAASISEIESIGCEGKVYTLPQVSERKVSKQILEKMNAIKTGGVVDEKEWIVEV